MLLSNTTLEVKIKGAITSPFISNIGSPQGDSISGPLFTTYFEEALKTVRVQVQIGNDSDLPEEMIYADDYDHLTENKRKKELFRKEVKGILGERNLNVNDDKTEETVLKRNKGNEPWKEVVKLGSMLGDREDICRRKQLANSSMRKINEILRRKRVVNLSKKLQLYNAMVKSILTYNSCTWGLTKGDEDKLDSFHRRQLREVIGVRYPHKISNKKVYEVTKATPLSIEITLARWKMLGHVLRLNEKTPARKAMKYYFQIPPDVKRFRGRKRATIISTINRDIERTKKKFLNFDLHILKTELDLRNIRVKATNRNHWKKRVNMVVEAAYSDRANML